MAIQKSKKPSLLGWPRRHKFISLLAVLVVAVAGYFVYEAVALQVNKHDFQQARAAIDSAYADIVSQVGPPDNYKRISKCFRSHEEFTQGVLSCNIDTTFIYGVADETEANALFKKIQSVIANQKQFKPNEPLSKKIRDSLAVNTYYHTAEDNYKTLHLDCVASYVYDTPSEISMNILNADKYPFEIALGCDGPARQQYYPLAY